MNNGNGVNSIWKALATGSAVTVLGVICIVILFFHFQRDDKIIKVIQENTTSNQEVRGMLEMLDRTISSKQGQLILQETFVSLPDSNISVPQFEVVYDPYYIPPTVNPYTQPLASIIEPSLSICEESDITCLKVLEELNIQTSTLQR